MPFFSAINMFYYNRVDLIVEVNGTFRLEFVLHDFTLVVLHTIELFFNST